MQESFKKQSPSRLAGVTQSLISDWQRILPKTSYTLRRARNATVKQDLSAVSQRTSGHFNMTNQPFQT